jgi:NADH dehydrogenase/NADH:ubiquinone oxidoreductase subunit G
MSELLLRIDGREVRAREGMTVLEAARSAGISIPTLCHDERLEPYAGCRLCIVEVQGQGAARLVCSCAYPVEEQLVVRTRSEKVDRNRKTLIELLLAHAPHSLKLRALAEQYGADPDRFEKESSFCVHCGLCVRYCAEIKKKNAVGFVERGVNKEISFIPEIASRECEGCKECFPLCPTSYLQAAYVLTRSILSASGEVRECACI